MMVPFLGSTATGSAFSQPKSPAVAGSAHAVNVIGSVSAQFRVVVCQINLFAFSFSISVSLVLFLFCFSSSSAQQRTLANKKRPIPNQVCPALPTALNGNKTFVYFLYNSVFQELNDKNAPVLC